MPGLSAKFDPDRVVPADPLDIRTRVLISLFVGTAAIYISGTGPLLLLSLATAYYVARSGSLKIILVTYAFVTLMCLFSLAFIFGTPALVGLFSPAAGENMKNFLIDDNFHTPFLRMIPSVNVVLAIGMNFQVQRFVGAMKSIHLPRIVFLPMMVFCRFIPEFVATIRQLHDAVLMRGFSMSFGSALIHPVKSIRLTIIPLAVRTLRIADNLSMVAEMKRIGYAKRPTQFRRLHFRPLDFRVLAAFFVISVAAVIWQQIIGTPTETRLEQLWAHDDYRPTRKLHLAGETTAVKIIRPGTRNPDPTGPDFLNAEALIDGQTVRGDIELTVFPTAWDKLQLRDNPKFANVRFYITWFGIPKAKTLSEDVRFISLRTAVPSNFDFTDLSNPIGSKKKKAHMPSFGAAKPPHEEASK